MSVAPSDHFQPRHIGSGPAETDVMLATIGVPSMDALIDQTVPQAIRLSDPLDLPDALTESEYLAELRQTADKNKLFKNYIGMGYYDCLVPSVILRNVMENPGWYTPYTPYQAEIAQGRLEALLNFQTMVSDLTGMEIANASLLDEATAAGEAMTMLLRLHSRKSKGSAMKFFVSDRCYPQTIEVLELRAEPLGIELVFGPWESADLDASYFGALVQFPDGEGRVGLLADFIEKAHQTGALVAVATDLLALTLLTPPGELGADVVFGNSQRFGVPMGFGGPHAAFYATHDKFTREMPGRIIGVSVDAQGQPAYRMALQTREQHIRREKAKSNICTAQALLATMASMYGVYHGPNGLKTIAQRVHTLTAQLETALKELGLEQLNDIYFDTLKINGADAEKVRHEAEIAQMNFRYFEDGDIGISLDETTTPAHVASIVWAFARAMDKQVPMTGTPEEAVLPEQVRRTTPFMTHSIFQTHQSETEMMRYLKQLERKDVGLDTSMIPLGSCTMKLNAATEMIPVTWPAFSKPHPFLPRNQAEGYLYIIEELCDALCKITGFAGVSLQPNSGAQGEYAGLMVIRAYLADLGEAKRTVCLIPDSAHGTNPASAVMAGFKVVVIKCDEEGNIDLDDLRSKAEEHSHDLAALMVTYPSTHGVFEESIREVCAIVHQHGGQVYMDGANLNAQVGLTSPGKVGADVCHMNLHKTFAIPHGGGGPGMGPIGVAPHLVPYLPGHSVVDMKHGDKAISAVSAAPWGSASILLISYAYIKMLGAQGVTEATKYAILNANYIKARLDGHFDTLFTGPNDRVAHEMIFDLRPFKQASGVDEIDVAKRLMDYGFHAPTVAWPVPGTMMVEPTESEDKSELDRFCDALISIREEIQEIIDGKADPKDNPLKNAPHTASEVCADTWAHPYSREKAAFPLPYVRENKVWPSVGRVDNTHGDRNLVCTCPGMEAYADA